MKNWDNSEFDMILVSMVEVVEVAMLSLGGLGEVLVLMYRARGLQGVGLGCWCPGRRQSCWAWEGWD